MDPFDAAPVKATVAVKDIIERPEWQVREAVRPHIVHQYKLHYIHGADMPPIQLANVGGALLLVDGWHRLEALRQLGRETADAVIEQLCEDDARWAAALANTRNGVRLKTSELLQAFHVYVRTRQYMVGRRYKSYREIAKDFGGAISGKTANVWMRKHYGRVAGRIKDAHSRLGGSGPAEPNYWKQPGPLDVLRRATDQAIATARSVSSPECRREIAEELERAAKEIAAAQPWSPQQATEDNEDF